MIKLSSVALMVKSNVQTRLPKYIIIALLLFIITSIVTASARLLLGGPVSGGGGAITVAYHDLLNGSGSSQTNMIYKWGQAFAIGDVPVGQVLSVFNGATLLSTQYDECSTWPDNSLQHCVFTVPIAFIGSGGNLRLTIKKSTGVYSPSPSRTISDLTNNTQLQVRYQNVVDQTFAAISGHYGVTSNNLIFDVNTAVSNGYYEIWANGRNRMAVWVFGPMTDAGSGGTTTGGAQFNSGTAWCWWWLDVLTNPSGGAYQGVRASPPMCGQPFVDQAMQTDFIGQARIYDGATLLRDFSGETGSVINETQAAFSASNAWGYTTTATQPGTFVMGEVYKFGVNSGSAPTGLTNGQFVFVDPDPNAASNHIYMQAGPDARFGSTITITSVPGSGSYTFTRWQALFGYQGVWFPQDDNGSSYWRGVSDPGLVPNLDGADNGTAQRAYWETTGLIPGWNLTTVPVSFDNSTWQSPSNACSQRYRPGSCAQTRGFGINAGGSGLELSIWGEWSARTWTRQGVAGRAASEWNALRTNALTVMHYPDEVLMRASGATGNARRIVPVDNGPNDAGGSYTTLGAPASTAYMISHSQHSGITVNASSSTGALWDQNSGIFADAVSPSHWDYSTPAMWYMVSGEEYALWETYLNANHMLWGYGFPNSEDDRTITLNGHTFYGKCLTKTEDRQSQGCAAIAYASQLGSSVLHPEKAYFQHVIASNLSYWDYYRNTWKQNMAARIGATGTGLDYFDWLFMAYHAEWASVIRNVTRATNSDELLIDAARQVLINCGGPSVAGISYWWCPAFIPVPGGPSFTSASYVQFDPPANFGNATSSAVMPTASQIFFESSCSVSITDTTGTIDWSAFLSNDQVEAYVPANGDTWVWRGCSGPGDSPPAGITDGTIYTVANVNTGAHTLSLQVGGSNISGTTPASGLLFAVRSTSFNPTCTAGVFGSCFIHPTNAEQLVDGYGSYAVGVLNELVRSGATYQGAQTALTDAATAVQSRWNTVLGYSALAAYNADPGWKWSMTQDHPVKQ